MQLAYQDYIFCRVLKICMDSTQTYLKNKDGYTAFPRMPLPAQASEKKKILWSSLMCALYVNVHVPYMLMLTQISFKIPLLYYTFTFYLLFYEAINSTFSLQFFVPVCTFF